MKEKIICAVCGTNYMGRQYDEKLKIFSAQKVSLWVVVAVSLSVRK